VDTLTGPPAGNLETARLRLRSWTCDDVDALLAVSTDPDVMHYFPRPNTRDEIAALVQRQQVNLAADLPGLYAVERLADRAFLGFVGLATPTFEAPFVPTVEIGWRLGKAYWNQGYATEAARAALRHGFETLGLPEVVSFTAVPNRPSRRVMEKLGTHHDPADDFDHPRLDEGHWLQRHVLYRLTREEWSATQGRGS
jgi:RimJ/RimL family protein N-acetyltransferase